ncbi:V-type ATP synthase subunit I [Candidatus Stoquefichus massiliensis]|uniref:V-type ATP synthase subunit I n=1 Tax=Candidatus Stoquefichus massiliensis TaxID=1470350 RepID=UPI0004891A18|nr:V-type ATPase 116kDa subunit family protein [Candidatus Stoquefichus massiliensis]
MAIAKLKLLEIEFPAEQYDAVLMKLINTDDFHPELASKFADSVQGLSVLNRENPYADLIARMEEARDNYHLKLQNVDVESTRINIIQADTFFCNVLEQVAKIEKVKQDLQTMIEENEATISQLEHMIDAKLDFDRLFSCKYLQIRFGRIPTVNLDKLQYYGAQEFLFMVLHKGTKETYCGYITTETKAPEIDNIFSSLYFERIHIPEFVHGTPQEALNVLKEEDETARDYLKVLDERINKLFNDNVEEMNHIYSVSKKLNETYDAQKYVVVFGKNAAVYGFAEEKTAKQMKADFETLEDVHVELKPAMGDSRLTPPTKLKNNWFSRPFRMFVEMYGVPSYTDFDPTNLVAISYTFLFGMMFGDIGQGIVLSLVGYFFYKWKGMQLGAVGMRLGISSTIFGAIFGSFFGYEHLYEPMFIPMESENTMTLLMAAIATGVILIIISIVFNIVLNLKKKHWGDLLFSQNGMAGLVFYVSVLLMVANMLVGLDLPLGGPVYIVLLIAMPVVMIFLKEPLSHKLEGEKMFPHGFGAFFTEAFFELFEVMLTFIANTMSFLRVGGFVLSHAGMMMVVYTLAKMVNGGVESLTFAYLLVIVIGNIFVMCLEGMIVGIQVLRLEFYEMFSRYYEGKGKPFIAIKEK